LGEQTTTARTVSSVVPATSDAATGTGRTPARAVSAGSEDQPGQTSRADPPAAPERSAACTSCAAPWPTTTCSRAMR